VYQIRTSSYNSIVDVNSGLDYVSALIGRFAMVPLKLRRTPIETHHNGSKQTHYTLQVIFDYDIDTLNKLREDNMRILEHPRYELPAPKDENPEFDPVDQVVDLEDEEEEPRNVTPQQPEEKPDLPGRPPPAGQKRPRPSAKDFEYLKLAGDLKKQIKQLSDGYEEGYYAVLKSCGIDHVDEAPDEKTRKKVIAGLRKAVKMLKESQEEKPKQKANQPTTVFEQSVQFYQETMGDEEFNKVLEQFHVKNADDLDETEREDFLVKCGRRLDAMNQI